MHGTKSDQALKETKLAGRPEFEQRWKLQNITINHYFFNHLIIRTRRAEAKVKT